MIQWLITSKTTCPNTSEVKKAILDQQVKLYTMEELETKDIKCKMHDKIWGQCTYALKSMIVYEKGY